MTDYYAQDLFHLWETIKDTSAMMRARPLRLHEARRIYEASHRDLVDSAYTVPEGQTPTLMADDAAKVVRDLMQVLQAHNVTYDTFAQALERVTDRTHAITRETHKVNPFTNEIVERTEPR
jgi:uncharacterized protein YdiU (UPF0061 family)